MPRKYELVRLKRDDTQGTDFWRGIPADLVESFMHSASPYEHVTAIDERDVSPLVEAAKLAVKELDYAPPGESERDASCRIKTKWLVEGALKPFEAEEGPG